MATSETNKDTNSSNHDGAITLDFPNGNGRPGLGRDVMYQYQGFWSFNFKASDTDVVISTLPKSGTLWLKALAFSIVNRFRYPCSPGSKTYHHHPVLTVSPHDLVPFFDWRPTPADDSPGDVTMHDSACRLIGTHVPYPSLPESIKTNTNCKIVYMCRNPRDNLISAWQFVNKRRAALPPSNDNLPPLSLEEAFELFCDGISIFGPFWDHVLGYWKESLEKPHKVLFMKYEDLKNEPTTHLKRLAEFMGCGFTLEEERQGVVEDISRLCSFETMTNLEMNKTGSWKNHIENKIFFRKGENDWKLQGSGLEFRYNHPPSVAN
ncbi:hypothetical protein MKW98_007370 [Papaver atlanticum]|uniref:Sulfotransferase n=1 Tax=Papaver atlanticum TaxID=357466 RepID=A0AAD4SDN4_9MAGN|nr:hypothetical protein MKW98_007370 [Papaver atlanticum]